MFNLNFIIAGKHKRETFERIFLRPFMSRKVFITGGTFNNPRDAAHVYKRRGISLVKMDRGRKLESVINKPLRVENCPLFRELTRTKRTFSEKKKKKHFKRSLNLSINLSCVCLPFFCLTKFPQTASNFNLKNFSSNSWNKNWKACKKRK